MRSLPTADPGTLRPHSYRQPRRQLARAVHALRRLAEITLFRTVNIDERLRIAVHQREPATLHLHHEAVPRPERVIDVRQRKLHRRRLAGRERLRLLVAVAEL